MSDMTFGYRPASVLGLVTVVFGAIFASASCAAEAPASPPKGGDGGLDSSAFATPPIEPDAIDKGDVDVLSIVRTPDDRIAISPLIYGVNSIQGEYPVGLQKAITFVRRGGDRANAYNWETNVSNGSHSGGFANDLYLVETLPNPNAAATLDLTLIAKNRKAGRGTMVPFVLNDYVAGAQSASISFSNSSFRTQFFKRVEIVKPSAFASEPDVSDTKVYTDEHFAYMKAKLGEDIYAPGPGQVIVGIDNEPDLYAYNFPMLQDGSGEDLFFPDEGGTKVGKRVTGPEFTQRFVKFAKRVRELQPNANIVGPSHYHFDGWTSWHGSMLDKYTDSGKGRWFMDDFLETAKSESEKAGARLLDTWDFHWYPQHMERETFVWDLDDSRRPLNDVELEHILQDTRSYWDDSYNEDSWITSTDHLAGPANILTRLQKHIADAYPDTHIGVSEYFPGGCAHIASGIGTVDSLGIFARMGVHLAAMWPVCERMEFAYGGIQLVRNADGNGLRFADVSVRVEHPEKKESSVYAGSDDPKRVTVLVTNKTKASRRVGLRIFNTSKLGKVATYRIDANSATPKLVDEDAMTKTNAYVYAAPALSASLLVFESN